MTPLHLPGRSFRWENRLEGRSDGSWPRASAWSLFVPVSCASLPAPLAAARFGVAPGDGLCLWPSMRWPYQALIAALPQADRALWAVAFHAGLRRGELSPVRWDSGHPGLDAWRYLLGTHTDEDGA
jgi:hypothetical protein